MSAGCTVSEATGCVLYIHVVLFLRGYGKAFVAPICTQCLISSPCSHCVGGALCTGRRRLSTESRVLCSCENCMLPRKLDGSIRNRCEKKKEIHSSFHPSFHPLIHSLVRSFILSSLIRSFVHSLMSFFTDACICV